MSRCVLAAAALLCVAALAARAQEDLVEREVRAAPGRDVRIGVYTDIRSDCSAGPLPAIRLVTAPAHGTVSVKRGTLKATNFKQCLGIEVPAFVGFYRAAAEFSGPDIFELEISTRDGRKQRQRIRVLVTKSPGAGAGDGI
jgi:uncharacterized membrane protein